MHLFPPPLELLEDEGFASGKDLFGRRVFGEGLKQVLVASSEPLVVAVNGPWGTGKSVFLKMWAAELRKEGFPVIYFDAFAHDYIQNAFAALAGEIIRLANNAKPAVSKKFKKVSVEAGKVVLKTGINAGVRWATGGLVGLSHLEGAGKALEDAIDKETEKAIESLFAERDKDEKTLDAFRKALAELPGSLGDGTKPLVFIIDELDRCRPSFALELLERAKHFFAVPGLHFILGVHLPQLEESVRVTYGDIDAVQYLQKFVSLSANLDTTPFERQNSSVAKYVNYLIKRMDFRQEDMETVSNCSELIIALGKIRDIKLRTLERIMSVLAVTCAFTTKSHLRLPPILAGLCVMKVLDPDSFKKAQAGTLSYLEASTFFYLNKTPSENDDWPSDWFKRWWSYSLDPEPDPDTIRRCHDALFRYSIRDRTRLVPIIATHVVDRFVHGDG